MTLYLDSSAVLRIVFDEPTRFRDAASYPHQVTSALAQVECLRTLDRLVLQNTVGEEERARRLKTLSDFLESVRLIEVSPPILSRAGEPIPTVLGTLDAIHLSTARIWKESHDDELTLATHDLALAQAARAFGIPVVPSKVEGS